MRSAPSNLPRLARLVAFEAAARLGSFTAAGQELHRTQSAISHAVKALEQDLGIRLFRRLHRAIELTQEGNVLHNSVSAALKHLNAATSSLRNETDLIKLELLTDTSIAYHWLMPRIGSIRQALPGIALSLSVSDRIEDIKEADLAIAHGDGNWPGRYAELLFTDEIFPVCTPAFIERCGPVNTLEGLAELDLIDLGYERWSWVNWTIWFTELGAPQPRLRRVFQSDLYTATIQAALAGQGVALAWRGLIDEHLRSGALVVPLDRGLRTGLGYYLISAPGLGATPAVRMLKEWIQRDLAKQKLDRPD